MKKCVYCLFSLVFLTLLVSACDDVTTVTTKDGDNSGTSSSSSVYTINLDSNGGSFSVLNDSIIKRKSGTRLGDNSNGHTDGYYYDSDEPTRTGYIFSGWYDTRDSGGIKYDSTTVITKNVTLYARWIEIFSVGLEPSLGEYNASSLSTTLLRVSGTKMGDSTSVGNSVAYSDDNKPYRVGYSFVGWYDASVGGTKYTAASVINKQTVLYARWGTLVRYTVTFNPSPGTIGFTNDPQILREQGFKIKDNKSSTVVNSVGEFNSFFSPTLVGKTFLGWYDAPTGGTIYDGNSVVSKDLTLYAHWF